LSRVQVELFSQRLRRNRADAGAIENVETAEINRQTVGREFRDLIEALTGLRCFDGFVRGFHKPPRIVANANIVCMGGVSRESTLQNGGSAGRGAPARRARHSVQVALLGVFFGLVSLDAQTAVRRATNISAILAYPNFYHMRPVLVVGTVAQQQNGEFRVSDGSDWLRVVPDGNAPDGVNEVRGQFWDIGRMKADDPRFATLDLRRLFNFDPEGAWPRPGEVTAIMTAAITPATTPAAVEGAVGSTKSTESPATPIRAIVLDPQRYVGQSVTITGQFYGRNLTGDLPDTPRQSRYDFVMRSADASVWVTNVRPRGKDSRGRNFELGLDARIDTGKWVQVVGTVRQGRGLLWLDGQPDSLALAQPPPVEPIVEEATVRVPAAPPAEVIFSAPTQDETDVPLTTNIRIQFSSDVDPATFRGQIRVTYLDTPGGPEATQSTTPSDFTTQYNGFNRVLEMKFTKPLERFRTLRVELADGILGVDKQPLKPWTLTFLLAGS
jgi:hypothetical protein